MKEDTTVNTGEWRPNPKNVVRFTLDGRTTAWLADCAVELHEMWEKVDSVSELRVLLDDNWNLTKATWKRPGRADVEYENWHRALPYGPNQELRFTVSIASNGGMTTNIGIWYQ